MSEHEIEVRLLPADLHPEVLQMRVDAFAVDGRPEWPEAGQPYYVPDDRRLGAFAGDTLLAHVAVWPFGQWLGGRRVPMGGVASVITKPQARGQGVAQALMREALHGQRKWGDVISCLYPTVPGLYRQLGYAFGGSRWEKTIRTDALSRMPRPDSPPTIRAFDFPTDLETVVPLLDQHAAAEHGRIHRDARRHRNMLEPDDEVRAWVAEREGRVVGFLQLDRAAPRHGDHSIRRQRVADLAADDRDAWLALWRLVASESPVAQFTSYLTGTHDLVQDEVSIAPHDVTVGEHPWMARLVDVRAAVERRGWPLGLEVTVPIQLTDPILRDNSGAFHLVVSRGQAELAPARRAAGTLSIGIGALSALYTGYVTASALQQQGRLTGGSDQDIAGLDAAFSGPTPWMQDYF